MVWWSYRFFRLASPPFLDETNWMNEGFATLDSFRGGGLSGFVHHLLETRTLAPYSFVAAVGFAIFGDRDWAPYAANGWLVFSLLLFVEILRQRERLPLQAWFVGAMIVLAFPISGYSVVSVLGDQAAGVFIAIGSIAFLQAWPVSESAWESWAGTAAWTFAFFTKATLFPETLLVFSMTTLLGIAIWIKESSSGARRKLFRKWLVRSAIPLLIAAPYYAIVGRALYAYLQLNNYGSLRQLWAFKGTAAETFLFYLTGFSGGQMLGPAIFLAALFLAVRLVLLRRDSAIRTLRFLALLLTLAVTYALPTSLPNKTSTVGSPLQFLIVLTAVLCAFDILRRFPSGSALPAIALACVSVLFFRLPAPLDARDSPAVVARNRTLTGLIDALSAQQLQEGERVFVTTVGFIGSTTLRYEFRKRRLPAAHFFDYGLLDDPTQVSPAIQGAAFVIATEPGNDEVFYTAPSAFIQAQTLALVQQNLNFAEIARFYTWRGKRYYLFGKRERIRAVFRNSDQPPEPPKPVLRRGFSEPTADQSRRTERGFEIEFPAPRGLYAKLKLRFRLDQQDLDASGPVTLRVDIPLEGTYSQRFTTAGSHEFSFHYVIRQHLTSTIRAQFHVDRGILFESAELNPVER